MFNLAHPLYVSFEQETIVNDVTTCKPPESAKQGRHDYGYVTVTDIPWGHEGPTFCPTWIGPIEDEYAEEAVKQTVDMLKAIGARVVQAGKEKGQWGCGIYKPHTDEQ